MGAVQLHTVATGFLSPGSRVGKALFYLLYLLDGDLGHGHFKIKMNFQHV